MFLALYVYTHTYILYTIVYCAICSLYYVYHEVLHDCVYNLDLSECNITTEELRLLWRLSSRLKKLDIGMRRGYRDTLTTPGE